ncbi:transcriptional regulator with XRE-family HTH domain [Bacillus sp. SORGH_AS 510]|uniref:helix-turn-helix domain-containing protein n=1 Tax=Bacillus sp. SORGH_AS_0510 TaxID=3041771 RepID=UPI00278837A5|nr:helix-turn-helix transcriptional regulator [Bacillus sp. SORGH_AS_0510]MDQ1146601.1 transcriptional regulator with XRE-family HTH domain [Bacillus sp. SORGH_AS_0510]
MSQGELADRMGVSKSLVSAVEKKTKPITRNFAKNFKRAVGITDAVLIDIEFVGNEIAEKPISFELKVLKNYKITTME